MTTNPQALRDLAADLDDSGLDPKTIYGYESAFIASVCGKAADTIDALRARVADLTDERDGVIQETLAAEENYEEARAEVARLTDDIRVTQNHQRDAEKAAREARAEVARLRDAFASLGDYAESQAHRTAFVEGVENIARAALGEGAGWGCRECGAPRATEQGGRCRTCEKYGETP